MGVKSVDLFVIINVAFFVTKALNLMAMFHNPAWQLCFLFSLALFQTKAPAGSLSGTFVGVSPRSEAILVPKASGGQAQS